MRLLNQVLDDAAAPLSSIGAFGADVGPGSFTGVRVGVTLAKVLALSQRRSCLAFTSFDLITRDEACGVPARKGQALVREPGRVPRLTQDLSEVKVGYGPFLGEHAQRYPHASRAQVPNAARVAPEVLVPLYLTEPGISTPRVPYGLRGQAQ